MMRLARPHNRAFSLVELSIVLVILGLLTGGILAGQALIRASELRAVTTEYQRYTTAMGSFRDKYFAIPGDMTNAQSFWTAAATCPGLSGTAATGVCNGNGDGLVGSTVSTSNEAFGFWEQLADAGLIEGSYTGNTGDASTASAVAVVLGTNAPKSKLTNAGWSTADGAIGTTGVVAYTDTNWWEGTYRNALVVGKASSGNYTHEAAIKPEEAWNIDSKMDDGMPSLGKVLSAERNASGGAAGVNCTSAGSAAAAVPTATYSLTNTSIACSLLFITGY